MGAPVKQWNVVSLFSGCGGMDLGFVGGFPFRDRYYDKLPFRITWANDLNKYAARVYKDNLDHEINVGNIEDHFGSMPKTADVIIGGFPCQDVSVNGLMQGAEGERTVLYRHMVEAIKRTKPRIFVAENVKGLLQSHAREFYSAMLAEFEAPGYTVSPHLYKASDYGVPQARERLFLVGIKSGSRKQFAHAAGVDYTLTAQDALSDLEGEPENHDTSHVWSKAVRSPDQGDRKLKADRPATTIRAEHHGNVQWHYALDRRISLREAARLQSFPDAFTFDAGMRETERMIGNAVPPVLAWHIAKAVREFLDTSRL
ncbi:MAG: DNA (cytosine-5-)-methyltransferase [Gammaproteobacteria bacterium]|nr:DNA (cytosine-5-)-methyltransferase [Gammaproteobacteria bacterium]